MSQLVTCDDTARRYAMSAQQHWKEAADLTQAANMIDAFLGPALVGVVIRSIAAYRRSEGRAALIDTINSYNDAARCTASPEQAQVAQKEVN